MTMEIRKEKVLEIAKRAGFVVDINGHGDRNADLHYTLDRFAQLIAAECAELCADIDGGENMFSRAIRKNFGVEQ